MTRPRIILAGGSGFLGSHLAEHLHEHGYDCVILSRSPATPNAVQWDGRTLGPWAQTLDGAAAVVNLAGRNVNCRYHAENRRQILESRLDSVRVLAEAMRRCDRVPNVWVQCATLAIHGDQGDRELDETSPLGEGFSPDVARAWEGAFNEADVSTRKVLLRISFVLGRDSGAMATLARLARCGLGGAVGDGSQYFSWIHVSDLCRIVRRAVEHPTMSGLYSATAPRPVPNAEFMAELRRALHRPWSPPAPRWAVHVGAWLMGTEPELALRSRRCVPRRLGNENFNFHYPDLRSAMANLYAPQPRRATGWIESL